MIICKFGFNCYLVCCLLCLCSLFTLKIHSFTSAKKVMLIFDSPWPFFLTYFLQRETNHKDSMHSNLNSLTTKPYMNSNKHLFGKTNYTFGPLTMGVVLVWSLHILLCQFCFSTYKIKSTFKDTIDLILKVEGWNWHN